MVKQFRPRSLVFRLDHAMISNSTLLELRMRLDNHCHPKYTNLGWFLEQAIRRALLET
jgi:hypothetical protein